MSMEDRLAVALRDGLDRVEVSPGDFPAALGAGDRLRRRRTATRITAAAAAAATVAALGAVVTGGDRDLDPAPTPAGRWSRLPDPPLSPRTAGLAVWTGEKALFVGGQTEDFCPPGADCAVPGTYARDGAAYDPATASWTLIADAPSPIASWTPHVLVEETLVIVDDESHWHSYDLGDDSWHSLPDPPAKVQADGEGLSAVDGVVYTVGRSQVHTLDLGSGTWGRLPPSPHQPRLTMHRVVATPEGIVVFGVDSTARNDGTEPSYELAEVWRGGAWHRAETSELMAAPSHWTGERLVAPTTGCVDGGEVNPFPRCVPLGGTFDPGSGTWAELPDGAPAELGSGGWYLTATAGPWVVVGQYLYDDAEGSWTWLGAPRDAESLDEVAAVLAGDTVIALGGIDWTTGSDGPGVATSSAWQWSR